VILILQLWVPASVVVGLALGQVVRVRDRQVPGAREADYVEQAEAYANRWEKRTAHSTPSRA
jgi:hypothetical protein